MPIWKITEEGPKKVKEIQPAKEQILESHLEDWIEKDVSILGEPLLIIGRQVTIEDVKDRLDLLALDPRGNAVIIELKRGKLKDPVDMQAARYASYISSWKFEDFEKQANLYNSGKTDFNFNAVYESFCQESDVGEIPDINQDQRVILLGSEIKDKLGSVALWLREHGIDIKVIEIETYKEKGHILLQPKTIVPLSVSRFESVGKGVVSSGTKLWLSDGKKWHLEKRCNPKTKQLLLRLDEIIRENLDAEGPNWNQKLYISYKVGNTNWPFILTHAGMLRLVVNVPKGSYKQNELAERLGVEEFNRDESLSDKFGLPSSILVASENDKKDRVVLRIKDDYDIEDKRLVEFLIEAYEKYFG